MGYIGSTVPIPLGQLGLLTDEPMSAIPPNAAIKAHNITLYGTKIEKSRGSALYTEASLTNPIVALHDWWPVSEVQRLIVATSDGKLWRDTGTGDWSAGTAITTMEIQNVAFSVAPTSGSYTLTFSGGTTAAINATDLAASIQTKIRAVSGMASAVVSGSHAAKSYTIRFAGVSGTPALTTSAANTLAPATTITVSRISTAKATLGSLTPDSMFAEGGAEVTNNDRKLFFFTGSRQVQVISSDGIVSTDLAKPALDWATGSFPTFGIIYQSRLVVFGVPSNPHRIYISSYNDHEDFASSSSTLADPQTYNIFSGHGEGLVGAAVYKGVLILFKRPFGVYMFDWRDSSTVPIIQQLDDKFGLASPHAITKALDDLLAFTSTGTITSLKATQAFGSLEQGDVLVQARIRNYIRETFYGGGNRWTHALYYPEKMTAYFSTRNAPNSNPEPFGRQNRLLVVDMNAQTPRFTIETKDQVNCFALRKDDSGIPRPIYGTNDGYVFLMDQTPRNVGGAPYSSEFQTPHIDFSYLDQGLADKIKNFDFLSITYESVGNYPFKVDILADGKFAETITFKQTLGTGLFILDESRLDEGILGETSPIITRRLPLHCSGRTLSLRIYNNNFNESFRIERCLVSFRVGTERSTGL